MDHARPSRRRAWSVAIIVIVIGIAALVIWLFTRPPGGADEGAQSDASASPTSSAPATSSSESLPPGASAPAPAATTAAPPASDAPVAQEREPVAPDEAVVLADGVQVELAVIEQVDGSAVAPGETSGPAIQITVRITNDAEVPLDAEYVVVQAYLGEARMPAPELQQPGGAPFHGAIAPGAWADGVYVFNVEDEQLADVLVGVDVRPGESTVTFRGDLR